MSITKAHPGSIQNAHPCRTTNDACDWELLYLDVHKDRQKLRERIAEVQNTLGYALECLTRPDDVDAIYRMETICRIKKAIRGGQ